MTIIIVFTITIIIAILISIAMTIINSITINIIIITITIIDIFIDETTKSANYQAERERASVVTSAIHHVPTHQSAWKSKPLVPRSEADPPCHPFVPLNVIILF